MCARHYFWLGTQLAPLFVSSDGKLHTVQNRVVTAFSTNLIGRLVQRSGKRATAGLNVHFERARRPSSGWRREHGPPV